MFEYLAIVPIDVTSNISAGTLLEYDTTNHRYTKLSTGMPVAVLDEAVTASQTLTSAKVKLFGIVYADELAEAPTEDQKAQLRQAGIFVETRKNA